MSESVYHQDCPILFSMKLIGHKWKIPIIWHLLKHRDLHYNELKRQITGITNIMLTRCLRDLERDGLVRRCDFKTNPPSVAYSLTPRGRELQPVLDELYTWGKALH